MDIRISDIINQEKKESAVRHCSNVAQCVLDSINNYNII